MPNEFFIMPITSLFCNCKLHALYCQMWVQIWLGTLDGWNIKIKVYAFSSRVEVLFPHTVNLTSAMVQDMLCTMGLETRMQPIVIDIEPVQGNLLKFAQYKSKLSMKNPCSSNISSWRKNMLKVLWSMWKLQGNEFQ